MKLTIGLEIHAQVNVDSKLFSPSKSQGCDEPNMNISCIDLGIPGTLPLLNEKVLEKAVAATIALDGQINKYSRFDR